MTRKMFNIRQDHYLSMEKYITDVLVRVQKLFDFGEAVEDEWVTFAIMNGVSSEYEAAVANIGQQAKGKITLDEVKTALLGKSERSRVKSDTTSPGTSDDVQKNNMRFNKSPKKIKCYNCGEIRHKKLNCPQLKNGQGPSSVAVTSKQGNATLLVTALLSTTGGVWIIDSGTTFLMTKDKELMAKLETRCEEVVVADNTTLKCESVGNVQLNYYSGNIKTFKTVRDVMYVPSLSTNLLSVSKMTQKGYVVLFDENNCKGYQKCNLSTSGIVEFTGSNKGYVLDRPVQEQVSAVFTSLSDQDLWHKRLAHFTKGVRQLKVSQ